MLDQSQSVLERNSIFEKFQSGFRKKHSTESALLRVLNYILLSVDIWESVILLLTLLTRAFFCWHLRKCLCWFKSYLSDRPIFVGIVCSFYSVAPLTCGVSQGSILAPSLFSLYMLPLGSALRKHGVAFHFYVDEIQNVSANETK